MGYGSRASQQPEKTMNYDPSKLIQMSHDATDRLNHLALTGITDRKSLIAAIAKDLPKDVVVIDASANGENVLLVRETGDAVAQ